MLRRTNLLLTMTIILILALQANAWATTELSIDSIKLGSTGDKENNTIYTSDEEGTITINFSYDTDGGDEVDGWQLWVCQTETGVLFDEGGFSGDDASVSFTTKEIETRTKGSSCTVDTDAEAYYEFDLYLTIDVTVSTVDGDEDEEEDNDTDLYGYRVVALEEIYTEKITVIIDKDAPAIATLSEEFVPEENSVTVYWDTTMDSEGGFGETDVKARFCVRSAESLGIDVTTLFSNMIIPNHLAPLAPLAADGDDEDEAAAESTETEETTYPVEDGDEEDELAGEEDDETPIIEDGDIDEEMADDTEDDTNNQTIEDGDTGIEFESDLPKELTGCYEAAPNGASGGSYEIGNLKNGIIYEVRAKAIDMAGNESTYWSEPIYVVALDVEDFWESYKKSGGKEDGGFCFIATAAYGSYMHKHVKLFRQFRDAFLLTNETGRRFVQWYYQNSPPAANFIESSPILSSAARTALTPIAMVLSFYFHWPLYLKVLTLLLLVIGLTVFYRFLSMGKEAV